MSLIEAAPEAGAISAFTSIPLSTPAEAPVIAPERLEALVADYTPLSFQQRLEKLYTDFPPERVLVTSSFAATSAYFLHIVSRIQPKQVIHFIDTGFHFPETVEYRKYLIDLLGLTVVDIKAEDWKHQFTETEQTYLRDPDFCCSINKIEPLEAVKPNFNVWVSSLMHWQTDHRAGLPVFELRRGILKFNPMIDVTKAERDEYIRQHQLPFHPLVA